MKKITARKKVYLNIIKVASFYFKKKAAPIWMESAPGFNPLEKARLLLESSESDGGQAIKDFILTKPFDGANGEVKAMLNAALNFPEYADLKRSLEKDEDFYSKYQDKIDSLTQEQMDYFTALTSSDSLRGDVSQFLTGQRDFKEEEEVEEIEEVMDRILDDHEDRQSSQTVSETSSPTRLGRPKANWKPLDWLAEADRLLKTAESHKAVFNFELSIPGVSSKTLLSAARERYKICADQFLTLPAPDKILYNLLGIIFVLGQANQSMFGGMESWQKFSKLSLGMYNSEANYDKFIGDLGLQEEAIQILKFVKLMADRKRLGSTNPTTSTISQVPTWRDPGITIVPSAEDTRRVPQMPFSDTLNPEAIIGLIEQYGPKPQSASFIRAQLQSISDDKDQLFLHRIESQLPSFKDKTDGEIKELISRIFYGIK